MIVSRNSIKVGSIIVILLSYVAGVYGGYSEWDFDKANDITTFYGTNSEATALYYDDNYDIALKIMLSNISVCVFICVLSLLSVGAIGIMTMYINGFTLGVFLSMSVDSYGLAQTLLISLPHSLLELIGISLAIYIGFSVFLLLVFRVVLNSWRELLVILALMILSVVAGAFVESFVSINLWN